MGTLRVLFSQNLRKGKRASIKLLPLHSPKENASEQCSGVVRVILHKLRLQEELSNCRQAAYTRNKRN